MQKRAALLLDRLMIALQKAIENEDSVGGGSSEKYYMKSGNQLRESNRQSIPIPNDKTVRKFKKGQNFNFNSRNVFTIEDNDLPQVVKKIPFMYFKSDNNRNTCQYLSLLAPGVLKFPEGLPWEKSVFGKMR